MPRKFRTDRLSNHSMEQDARHLALARASIELGRKVLTDNPPPDTFFGRNTQELAVDNHEHSAINEMANMKRELRHLSKANEHIAKAEYAISEQTLRVERLRGDGHDTKLAEETLRAFEVDLTMLLGHREAIIRAIEQIDQAL